MLRGIAIVLVAVLAAASAAGCAQRSEPASRPVEKSTVSWETRVEQTLARSLESTGAAVSKVEPKSGVDDTTVVTVRLPADATPAPRDLYRAIAAVRAAGRMGNVDVVFTRYQPDETKEAFAFFWQPDGRLSRADGGGKITSSVFSATYVGRTRGVMPSMIGPISRGEIAIPKLDPMPPATE